MNLRSIGIGKQKQVRKDLVVDPDNLGNFFGQWGKSAFDDNTMSNGLGASELNYTGRSQGTFSENSNAGGIDSDDVFKDFSISVTTFKDLANNLLTSRS